MPIKRPPQSEPQHLRASASPVNTFVRPEDPLLAPDPAQPTALLQLADSLRGLSPRLARLGDEYRQTTDEQGEVEALGLRLKTTADELTQKINRGEIDSSVNRMALDLGHGEDLARQDYEELHQNYLGRNTATDGSNNAFDRETGNLDAWWAEAVSKREQAVPKTAEARHGYYNQMLKYRQQLKTEHDAFYAQRTKEANLDAAYKDLYGTAVGSVATGERDVAKIHGNMREAFEKTRKLHLLTPAEADDAMAVAANSIAVQGIPGNPQLGVDLVREIFLGSRDGVPPLGSSAKYADISVKTIEQAETTARELQRKLNVTLAVDFKEAAATGTLKEREFIAFTEANPHVFTQAEREQILLSNRTSLESAREKQRELGVKLQLKAEAQASEQDINVMLSQASDAGTLLTIPEKVAYKKDNGETSTYGRSELIDRAVDNKLAELDAWAQSVAKDPAAKGVDVEALKFDRELDFFKRNPVKHPQWADILNAGYSSAAPDTLAGATQAPPHLLQAVKLYEDLEAKAPGLLDRHLNSQGAKDFYQTYRTARTLLRQDERQALHTAALATKGLQDEAQFQPSYDALDTELRQAESFWPWARGIQNFGEMQPEVRRLGRVLVRAGASPEDALTRAGEAVRKSYTNINGYMVRTSDRNVESFGSNLAALKLQPREFVDVVQDYLKRYASDEHDPESLSIRPMTNGVGTWAVIDAVTGFPVGSNSGLSPQFSMRDLLEFERARQSGEIDKKLEELRNPRSNAPHNLIRRFFGFDDVDLYGDDEEEAKP